MSRRSFDPGDIERARQALLDNRAERSHSKRHRTRRRSTARKAKAKRRAEAKLAQKRKDGALFIRLVRAYWAGETDAHP